MKSLHGPKLHDNCYLNVVHHVQCVRSRINPFMPALRKKIRENAMIIRINGQGDALWLNHYIPKTK